MLPLCLVVTLKLPITVVPDFCDGWQTFDLPLILISCCVAQSVRLHKAWQHPPHVPLAVNRKVELALVVLPAARLYSLPVLLTCT